MDNINEMSQGLVPKSTPLELPGHVPSDQELQHLITQVLYAVLSKHDLSASDATLLDSLIYLRSNIIEE